MTAYSFLRDIFDSPILTISGYARENGFVLYTSNQRFTTTDFEDNFENNVPNYYVLIIYACIVCIAVFFGLILLPHEAPFLSKLLFDLSLTFILLIVTGSFFISSQCKSWHACEHKLAFILSHKLPLTFESLQQSPSISIHCGSIILLLILEGLGLILFWFWAYISNNLIENFFTLFFSFCSLYIPLSLFFQYKRGTFHKNIIGQMLVLKILGFLSLPNILLLLTVQRLTVIRTPDTHMLEKTLRDFKQFLESEEGISFLKATTRR